MDIRRNLITDALMLLVVDVLILPIWVIIPAQGSKYFIVINILGIVLIALRVAQTFIDRSRSHYDIKDPLYHTKCIALWWSGAIITGLLIDLAMALFWPSEAGAPFLATIVFAVLGLLATPLYLIGEWWTSWRKQGK